MTRLYLTIVAAGLTLAAIALAFWYSFTAKKAEIIRQRMAIVAELGDGYGRVGQLCVDRREGKIGDAEYKRRLVALKNEIKVEGPDAVIDFLLQDLEKNKGRADLGALGTAVKLCTQRLNELAR